MYIGIERRNNEAESPELVEGHQGKLYPTCGGCSSVGLERLPVEEKVGSSRLLSHPKQYFEDLIHLFGP